ncbi:MAG: BA14K family protein [Aestuariivirga sp.]|jgi:BA14K-like protein|uniref:BA14K family protein n=1 Tax=Aestuariivirga sp. TaxID=2650926 RepID=UPI00301699E6
MFRKILTPLLGLLGLAALSSGAMASDAYGTDRDGIKIWKPYVIEKTCSDGLYECTVRMDYAPFQRSMVVRPGSYWYQKPFQVYRYGDFKPRRAAWNDQSTDHEAWCSARYRTYDPATDTFVGNGYKRHRCISP